MNKAKRFNMSKITIDKAVLERVLNAILNAVPQTASQAKEQLESLLALREALAQPQPEPAWWPAVENILDEYGLQAIDFVADFKAALAQPQPEPVPPELFAQQIAAAMRFADAPLTHDQFVTLVLYLKARGDGGADNTEIQRP